MNTRVLVRVIEPYRIELTKKQDKFYIQYLERSADGLEAQKTMLFADVSIKIPRDQKFLLLKIEESMNSDYQKLLEVLDPNQYFNQNTKK